MFNEYPYVNIQDVNLDWILKHIKDLENNLQDFVKLNTIKYADPIIWNITKQYETNTVVIDGNTGTAYISVQPVPAGVALTNTDYWTVIFTLNLTTSNQNITFRDDGTNVVATFASDTNDWLLWNFYLYRVTQPISINTAYVEGFNIERFSVELFIKYYIDTLRAEINDKIGDLDDLTTSDITNIVNAINSLQSDTNTKIGDLDDLTTSDTTDIVKAINSLKSDTDTSINNIDVSKITFYNTVADIPNDLTVGTVIGTKGFYAVGDGGSCIYEVVTDDTGRRATIYTGSLYLMVLSEPVNILAIGCKLNDNTFDNTPILNNAFSKYSCRYFSPYGDLRIEDGLLIPKDFNGSIDLNCRILAANMSSYYAVKIVCKYCHIHIKEVINVSGLSNKVGILIGGDDLTYYVYSNTFTFDLMDQFYIGLKLESSNTYGNFGNKFYLTRIDNCDKGVVLELIGNSASDGFINQNQFYNLWVTGDGYETKIGIEFIDNTVGYVANYNENNFLNISAEGCGTIVKAKGMNYCKFTNIRTIEQSSKTLTLFDIGNGCRYNTFDSSTNVFYYDNIVDTGFGDEYNFRFYNRSNQHICNKAVFKNGIFKTVGQSLLFNYYYIGSGHTTYTIDPLLSVDAMEINRSDANVLEVILPNNATDIETAPEYLIVKVVNVGNGFKLKTVDGTVVGGTTGEGLALTAGHTYLLKLIYDNAWRMLQIA